MVKIIHKFTLALFIIQIVSFFIYNRHFIINWISDSSNSKIRWVKKRDRFILFLSIYFLFISYFISVKIVHTSENITYLFSGLMLAMTLTIISFYCTKFKIFDPGVRKRVNSKGKIIIRENFALKKISESDLFQLIENSYKDSFSSDFIDFKRIFIDRDEEIKKLICIDVDRNKKVGYSKIFELMHDLSENGILDLWDEDRKNFIKFVKNNFQRGNKIIVEKNLDSSYSKWLGKNR
ncbi:hypothetical protein INR75_11560 [Zunongwangia sp. SCSIO 43204]|uniref:hypothetical protein n=1 Tax=Zunongwangia sp. SCSIO 43204 TaxID=2779359 RepID=UPI001CA8568E|nr:hypothetical protein [Zunongwangia sp. SCSIO 43204]UAB82867.1 hypothetical protein INR75_11560 [Zunongwangia sp. SCSIO 43204]